MYMGQGQKFLHKLQEISFGVKVCKLSEELGLSEIPHVEHCISFIKLALELSSVNFQKSSDHQKIPYVEHYIMLA